MAENDRSSKAPARPSLNLPPRSSMESLYTGGGGGGGSGASPGPMTIVSNFFSQNDPDSDCRSFSQLLAGAMSSPAAVPRGNNRHSSQQQQPPQRGESSNSKAEENDGGGGRGDVEFMFQQNRPAGLVVTQPSMFTIPPGLSPATLLDSPGFFSSAQGLFGFPNNQALAQATAQNAQSQGRMHVPNESLSLSSAPAPPSSQLESAKAFAAKHQKMPAPGNIIQESSDVSSPDQRSQPSIVVDKPADDGYNWRKYGQKQVKGCEFPRSYYKCTNPSCPVKKKVERSHDGQVTEIIYKGQHNHQLPPSSKRAKDGGYLDGTLNLQGNMDTRAIGMSENLNTKDGRAILEHVSGSSDGNDMGGAESGVDGGADDEPEPKRRNIEVQASEASMTHRTVAEPRIVVQTTSEVDLLDDGYRWRKYGQKVVKGNPYPRSYYKCTASGCNVRKHVERAASDAKAVITTYEGKHNHDVPAAKNSSHNTASQLKPHNPVNENHVASSQRMEFTSQEQQSMAFLRFKEEQMT